MEISVKGKTFEIEPNSKPYFLKHLIALLADTLILFGFFFGLFAWFVNTPLADTYNRYKNEIVLIQDKTLLETEYGYKDYTADPAQYPTYKVYTDDMGSYIVLVKKDATEEQKNAYIKAINSNQNYKDCIFGCDLHNYLICALAFAVSETVLFLIIPLIDKKRRTIGKIVVNISLYSIKNQSYAYWYHVMFRWLLTLVFETLVLFPFLSMYTFIAVPVIEIVFSLINTENRSLRDVCTLTKLIEDKSYLPIDVLESEVTNQTKQENIDDVSLDKSSEEN